MNVSPIQNKPLQASSPKAVGSKPRPQGLGSVPDRLEERRSPAYQEPPSFFKTFLFDPILRAVMQVGRWILRGIFTFVDFLRKSAFEEPQGTPAPLDKDLFLERLRLVPHSEKLLLQFEKLFSPDEQTKVYWTIGKACETKTSWKEYIWNRTPEEHVVLGRRLVQENPYLLRDFLF